MKTWDGYKDHVRSIDSDAAEYLDEAENISRIISAITAQRHALGLTQRELASRCGIPQSSVARIESLRSTPNLDTLIKILQQLGLQLIVAQASPAAER